MERTPELTLLLEACRAAFERRALTALALDRPVDWTHLVRLTRFHRVQGLAWQALAGLELPTDAASALSADAQATAETNLRTAVESARILAAFQHAGVDLLFIKGLTLAALAYGGIAAKSAIDVDLLIDARQIGEASAALQRLGYELAAPRGGYDRLAAWHRLRKESVWRHGEKRLEIDLHTRLADNPRLIPTIGSTSPTQSVEIATGISLPTLRQGELFAYLCVHGASSAWFRLKWITDLAALLSQRNPAELAELFNESQRLGAGRAAGQALLLADALYGSLSEVPALRQALLEDSHVVRLCRSALRQVSTANPTEPRLRRFGTMRVHLTQFGLRPGWRYNLSELVRQARVAFANAAAWQR